MDEGISLAMFIAGFGGLLMMTAYAVGVHIGWIDDSELCADHDDDEPRDPRDDGDYDRVADGENQGGHS